MRAFLIRLGILVPDSKLLPNRYTLNEWSGAMGDVGTLLPLVFALIVFNGYSSALIFLLFGLVYLLTGWFYRVPVSVQPLKAMSVIAIAMGFSPQMLATTSFLYGILFISLALSGAIRWLQKWFSPVLVRGIQFGIGLILTKKAIELVWDKGLLLHLPSASIYLDFGLLVIFLLLIWWLQLQRNIPIALIFIFLSILIFSFMGITPSLEGQGGVGLKLLLPDISFWKEALVYLIIPQLPLTLGNAVYAASDTCHTLWGRQARRVTPSRLALSIGLSDTLIGLLGGFPVCHGAGGMGAHAQFGARTGGATMIMGGILLICALIPGWSGFIFLIPVPLLAAMLIYDSYRMMSLVRKLENLWAMAIAVLVGFISFVTSNLTIALFAGFLLERIWFLYKRRTSLPLEGMNDD